MTSVDLFSPPQADLKERYSVNELLADLAGCRATRVLLFVDQSYSGVLSKRLRGSQKHLNVVLIPRQTWPTFNQPRSSPGRDDGGWSHIGASTCLLDHLEKVCLPLFFSLAGVAWRHPDWFLIREQASKNLTLPPWEPWNNITAFSGL